MKGLYFNFLLNEIKPNIVPEGIAQLRLIHLFKILIKKMSSSVRKSLKNKIKFGKSISKVTG